MFGDGDRFGIGDRLGVGDRYGNDKVGSKLNESDGEGCVGGACTDGISVMLPEGGSDCWCCGPVGVKSDGGFVVDTTEGDVL